MRKVVVPNEFLAEAAKLLKEDKAVKLHIDGQSMFPFIRGGKDLVEVIPWSVEKELPTWCCPFYQWNGQYMIHRLIGEKEGVCRMMGDGNLCRVEEVERHEIIGILRHIYRPNGSIQDCMDVRWRTHAKWWYRVRSIRRFLIFFIKIFYS